MVDWSQYRKPSIELSLPSYALWGAALVIALTLGIAAAGRFADVGTLRIAEAPLAAAKSLRFVNGTDGGVTITDGRDGHLVRVVTPGTDGFIWGAVNALSRGRKLVNIGNEPPFTLGRRTDGRLVLIDPSTGQSIILAGFGHGNSAVFAKLLDSQEATR